MARFFIKQRFLLFMFALLQAYLISIYWRSMKSLYSDDIPDLTISNIGIEYLPFGDDKVNATKNDVNAINSPITSTSISISETDKPSPYLTMYGAHRAEKSFALLPKWLQTYFDWHGEQTRNRSNNTKYVVLSCHGPLKKCGGMSDRLRPLPFYLLFASLGKRVLCIHWTRPFGLENYLMPPMYAAGMMVDWRCPADVPLDVAMRPSRRPDTTSFYIRCFIDMEHDYDVDCVEKEIKRMRMMIDKYTFLDLFSHTNDRINVVNNYFQLHSYADEIPMPQQWQFIDLTGDIFRVMFEPVLALTQSINDTMTSLGLKENGYSSVHVRSRYPIFGSLKVIDKQGGLDFELWKNRLRRIIDNAVSCANHIAINSTIYFSSDNHEVVHDTVSRDITVGRGMQVRPVVIQRDKEPLHSDGDNPESQISDFFPMFEDLLIMGGGSCVSHGMGSFGAFGAGLSGNRCRVIHRKFNGKADACPNIRTNPVCTHNTTFYKGKILLESEIAKEGLIYSHRCDDLR